MLRTPVWRMRALLIGYVVVATAYSLIVPPFEASDELWHFPTVAYIATHGAMPTPDASAPWRQQGGQPPLYYMLAAGVTGWIDTSDLAYVRRVNPHADIGVERPDGNANMIVQRPTTSFPYTGTRLALHLARLVSVALGACTVWVTYQLGRALFPHWETVWLGAAALHAFLPMFAFISGSVNNDNLSNLLGNAITLVLVLLVGGRLAARWQTYTLLGVLVGAGLLAKLNLGFLVPLVALALLVVSVQRRDPRVLLVGGAVSGGLTILVAGWWYVRNWQLWGEPTGLSAFLATVGTRSVPASFSQLWAERHSFLQAYWGYFGGMNVPLPGAVYVVLNTVGAAAIAGVVALVVLWALRGRADVAHAQPASHASSQTDDRRPRPYVPASAWGAALTLLWIGVTFGSYLRWTAETPASQGRLMFGALSSLSVWMAAGLTWWLSRRAGAALLTVLAAGLLGVNGYALAVTIPQAYTPQIVGRYNPAAVTGTARFVEPDGDGALTLMNAEVPTVRVAPDAYAIIETHWQVAQPLDREWSLFVHLMTADGVIVAQRDVYPGGGLLATSDLGVGVVWENPVAVRVPYAAVAPQTLDVRVGWYDLRTGERLRTEDGDESVQIARVEVVPRSSDLDVPNPIRINFDDRIELVGYALSTLSPAPGEAVTLTLYWRALRPLDVDYTVFAHIIDPRTFTIYAGSDAQPQAGGAPTSGWRTGEIVIDTHTLTVRDDTPSGQYELELGWYRVRPDGTFPRLRVLTDDGGIADNFIYLNRVHVAPAADEEQP